MPQLHELEQWQTEVSTRMPHLSKAQAIVLALYSFGMAISKHSGITTIVSLLAMLTDQSPCNLRQRLREWLYEAHHKRGSHRTEIQVSRCFAPLLNWVLTTLPFCQSTLTLAMDVTYLGERFTILAISVVYGGSAIPVAWRILPGNATGEWHPLWVELLTQLHPAVPRDWTVMVLTDRGLYSKRLFQTLCQLHWHPVMRIRAQGLWRRERDKTWHELSRLARPAQGIWCQRVLCFKGDPLVCTLLVQWEAAYHEPCLIVTDFERSAVEPNAYTLRAWIEAGFKDLKRGGFHWEHTKITQPQRAERLWLVMALALFWLMRLGEHAHDFWLSTTKTAPPTSLSYLTLGWLTLLARLMRQPSSYPFHSLRPQRFHPPPLITYP